jgi:hypothetical protein
MNGAFVLFAVALLVACSRLEPASTVDTLARDPSQLYALRHRCATARIRTGAATCRIADAASGRRFFLGLGDRDEYQTLASLPPNPASFNATDDGARP